MAYVTAEMVVAHLNKYFAGTQVQARMDPEFEDDCDPSVDEAVQFTLGGEPVDELAVQVGGGYVCLNQYGYSGTGASRRMTQSTMLGSWGVQPADLEALSAASHKQLKPAMEAFPR